jgi:Tfp pilus assembly protein PilO
MKPLLQKSLSRAMNDLTIHAMATWNRWRQRYPKSFSYLPQSLAACMAFLTGCCLVWLLPYQAAKTDLDRLRQQESSLKQAYIRRLPDLPEMRSMQTRKLLTEQKLVLLRQQLTGNSEQETVMNEIDTAGRARGLRFLMFKPEVKQKTTIQLSAIGNYEAIARFVDDIAQLPRIVILDPLTLHAVDDSGNSRSDRDGKGNNDSTSARLLNLQATAIAIQPETQQDDRHETQE